MAANNQKPNIRIRFKRAGTLTVIALASAIVLSLVALVSLQMTKLDLQRRTEQAAAQAAMLEQRSDYLRSAISSLGTVDGIRQIARNELGLVDPGSIVFHNQSN